jgi:hypothetical protein
MRALLLLPASALLAATACDDFIYTPATDGPAETGYTADWASVRSFFDAECNQCHSATPPLLPDAIEADIVDGTGYWVVPGSSADSALWRVLADETIEGDFGVMPYGTGPLPLEEVAFVRD